MNQLFAFCGKKQSNTFEPSSGGNGIKLKTPSPMLVIIIPCNIRAIIPPVCESIKLAAKR